MYEIQLSGDVPRSSLQEETMERIFWKQDLHILRQEVQRQPEEHHQPTYTQQRVWQGSSVLIKNPLAEE